MFEVGDRVMLDGARGVILEIEPERCHVAWEDCFVSWEKTELLQRAEDGAASGASE